MNNESAPSKLSRTPIAVALAMICCFLWGSAFPCIKIGYKLFEIPADSPASQIFFAGIRFFIAGIMVIAAGSIGEKKLLLPTKRAVPKILSLSLFQTILQYIFFYIGLANTSGVKASVIEGTSAFICIIISALIFRMEKLIPAKILGCLIGTAGIVVINLDSSLLSEISFMGDGFVFISIVAYSVSSVLIKRFSASENPVMLSGWQFLLGGAVMIAAGALAGGKVGAVTAEGLLMLLYLAFISACAYSLWALLLKHNPVSKIAVFGFMNPVFGVLLSAFLLGETEQAFRLESVIALLLIAAGIFIVNKKSEAD